MSERGSGELGGGLATKMSTEEMGVIDAEALGFETEEPLHHIWRLER